VTELVWKLSNRVCTVYACSAPFSRHDTVPKVIRVIARLNIGGPARHAVILQQGLTDAGYTSVLVHGTPTPDEGSFEQLIASRGLTSVRLAGLGRRVNPFDDIVAFWSLLSLIFREQPDILHTHTAKAGTLGRLAGWLLNLTRRRHRRCQLVHTFHGHVFSNYFSKVGSFIVRLIERTLARGTDAIVTISNRQRDDIVQRFRIAPAAKVAVIPLGLELDDLLAMDRPLREWRTEIGWTEDEFVVGFVGRIVPVKDVPTLLHAFAALVASVPQARLLVVGDGECREQMESMTRSLGLSELVRFAGWQLDLKRVYGAMDVVALTSRNEGTPVALIEALAAGRPVVSTMVGGVPDVIQDGDTGLLVPPGDPDALAAALARMAREPALRGRLAAAGRRSVADRFGRQRLVQDIDALYQRLLAKRMAV
jgi:glycosyltransferase involved in cell wall biosynthesis